MSNDPRRVSLFNRWASKQTNEPVSGFDGLNEEEIMEYKAAFRLFDKVLIFIWHF